jgi:hypothetical protein
MPRAARLDAPLMLHHVIDRDQRCRARRHVLLHRYRHPDQQELTETNSPRPELAGALPRRLCPSLAGV